MAPWRVGESDAQGGEFLVGRPRVAATRKLVALLGVFQFGDGGVEDQPGRQAPQAGTSTNNVSTASVLSEVGEVCPP